MLFPVTKPIEYWFVIAGMVLYLLTREGGRRTMRVRLTETAASGLLAIGLSPSIAPYVRGSETVAAVVFMAGGILVLDAGIALLRDKAWVQSILKRRIGGEP